MQCVFIKSGLNEATAARTFFRVIGFQLLTRGLGLLRRQPIEMLMPVRPIAPFRRASGGYGKHAAVAGLEPQ
jgi:hypothetical protein